MADLLTDSALLDPDLLELDATDLIAAVAAGRVSAAEMARLYLARIEALNPALHAVITVNPQAMQEAGALDNLPPDERGPLHGLPLLIKDNIDVAGLPTTAGSALMARHVPLDDAPLVARLRAAGASRAATAAPLPALLPPVSAPTRQGLTVCPPREE